MSLLEDREGSLWVATQGGGVSRYESILNYTHVDGLGDNQVGTLLEDSIGDVYKRQQLYDRRWSQGQLGLRAAGGSPRAAVDGHRSVVFFGHRNGRFT